MRHIEFMITEKLEKQLNEIGTTWARQEFDLAQDEERKRQEWTRGMYCGSLPDIGEPLTNELVFEFDDIIDEAAILAWDALWDAKERLEPVVQDLD